MSTLSREKLDPMMSCLAHGLQQADSEVVRVSAEAVDALATHQISSGVPYPLKANHPEILTLFLQVRLVFPRCFLLRLFFFVWHDSGQETGQKFTPKQNRVCTRGRALHESTQTMIMHSHPRMFTSVLSSEFPPRCRDPRPRKR